MSTPGLVIVFGVAIVLLCGCAVGGVDEADNEGGVRQTAPAEVSVSAEPGTSSPTPTSHTPRIDASNPAPYIAGVVWADTTAGPSLQISPTNSGRYTVADAAMDDAWAEVLALEPVADTQTMRDQFDCHWRFARLTEPEKPTWNLEPERPVVTEQEMIAARCNPGMPEEQ